MVEQSENEGAVIARNRSGAFMPRKHHARTRLATSREILDRTTFCALKAALPQGRSCIIRPHRKSGGERAALQTLRETDCLRIGAPASGLRCLQHRFSPAATDSTRTFIVSREVQDFFLFRFFLPAAGSGFSPYCGFQIHGSTLARFA